MKRKREKKKGNHKAERHWRDEKRIKGREYKKGRTRDSKQKGI